MAIGIETLKGMLHESIAVVNAVDKFKHFNYLEALEEMKDLEASELAELAKDVKILELSDEELETKIEALAEAGVEPLAFIIRLVKIFMPKKP